MEFLFLFILLIISVFVHLILKLKIEQSIFFTVCSFFIIMLFSGLASNLSLGFYITIALSAVSLVYIINKAIKKEIVITGIITPGFAIFVLAFTVYYFSTQGALVHLWDESTHWGTSAKKMYYANDLWTSGLQTIATPIYNQVMLKFTGFKESALYLSQWVLYLSCIVLPLSNIKWEKSYLAAFYTMAAIFAVSSILEDGNLTLYADGLLAFFFANLILAWYLEKEQKSKRYIWTGIGIFMLVQMKSGTGTSLAATFLAFSLFSDSVFRHTHKSSKEIYINNLKTAFIFLGIILVSQYSYKVVERSFTAMLSGGGGVSDKMGSSIIFILLCAFIAVSLILFAIYSINIFKQNLKPAAKKAINSLLIVSLSLTFISFLGVLFYGTILRPEFDVRTTVLNFFTAFEKTKILGFSVKYLIAVIIVVYIINILIEKKEQRKELLIFYIVTVFFSGLYLVGVLYAYLSSFSLGEAVNMASFDRYVGTALMFSVIFAFLPMIQNTDKPLKQCFIPYLPLAACVIFLSFHFIPSYKATQSTREETLVFRQTEISAANQVKALVPENVKVFLVIQGDQGFVFNWMRYEFAPITTNGGYWSFGDNGGWNFAWNEEKMKQFFHDAKYDYLYLFKTNEYFNERFASLFGENIPQSYTLYKFNYETDTVFSPVD